MISARPDENRVEGGEPFKNAHRIVRAEHGNRGEKADFGCPGSDCG